MTQWCSGCISIGFDAKVGYVSVRHLTEPAPYTGQILSPTGAHSVSDAKHPFSSARHTVSQECSYQFVPFILVNYNLYRLITRFDSGIEFSRIFLRRAVFECVCGGGLPTNVVF